MGLVSRCHAGKIRQRTSTRYRIRSRHLNYILGYRYGEIDGSLADSPVCQNHQASSSRGYFAFANISQQTEKRPLSSKIVPLVPSIVPRGLFIGVMDRKDIAIYLVRIIFKGVIGIPNSEYISRF